MMSAKNQIKIIYTMAVVAGLASIFALLYPWISSSWNQFAVSKMVVDYTKQETQQNGEVADYSKILKDAEKYNEELYASGNNHISEYTARVSQTLEDQLSGNVVFPDAYYESFLSFSKTGMIGYITIPKINVLLPIKHYTTSEVLATGVGHLYGSSFPIGGENTHAALTGHSALMTARLFTDLEKLKIGDTFTITVAGKNLNYEIDQIKIVAPDEFKDLTIEEGRDLVTLITCTPYAVNTHRLLVRGYRIADDADVTVQKNAVEKVQEIISLPTTMLATVGLIFATGIIIIILIWRRNDYAQNNQKQNDESSL
jgi:sortase A